MNIIRMLIGIPIATIILVFAFVNNDLATFSLWPFNVDVTVSLSVVVIVLIVAGFIMGRFSAWFAYAPLRKELFKRKKENKKLSEEHKKLNDTVGNLQGNLESLRSKSIEENPHKVDFSAGEKKSLRGFFSRFKK